MIILSDQEMQALGKKIGVKLRGGEVFELIGDIGTGKTTLVKGIALGLKIDDDVQSPTFTIQRSYKARDDLVVNHYDFYRLEYAGIMAQEIEESLYDPKNILVIEWGESVKDVLPPERVIIKIDYLPETGREVTFQIPEKFAYLNEGL